MCVPSASHPVLCSGSRFGAFRRPAARRRSSFLRRPPRTSLKDCGKEPLKLIPGPFEKALLGTWEPGPLARFAKGDPSRIREIQRNGDHHHVPEQSHSHRIPWQRCRSSHQQRPQPHHSFAGNEVLVKKDGSYIEHTEWHRCVVFSKLAEFAATLKKGAHIQVEGELRSRKYTGSKTNSEQTIWEIRVNSILKLDRAAKASTEDGDAASEEEAA